MFVKKRTHQRALDIEQAKFDTLEREHQRLMKRKTAIIAENVTLFAKLCKEADHVYALEDQLAVLREQYADLRIAYDCVEKAALILLGDDDLLTLS